MTPALRKYLIAATIITGAVGIFWLPYAFPPQTPTYSESYTLGFSNRVAVLAVWLTLGLLGLLAAKPSRLFTNVETKTPQVNWRVPAWWWIAVAAAYAGIDLIVWACVPLDRYGESAYTLPRVAYAAHLGLHPYREFEFAYGPGLLYVPVLAQVIFGTLANAELVYTSVHILMNAVGLALFAWTLNAVPLCRSVRAGAFVLLSLAWANPTMGMQYVTLRWVLPFALLTWIYRKIPAVSDEYTDVRGLCLRVGASIVAMLLVSPEYSAVLCVALGCIFGALAWARGRAYLIHLLSIGVAVGAFVLVAGPAYLQSILGFASGGMLFPVYPTLAILVYLAALALTVPPVLKLVVNKGPGAAGLLAFGWMLLCMGLIPGALGRCDSGHVLMYGWPTMLAASAIISQKGGALARLCAVVWVFAFVIGGQTSLYLTYKDDLRPVWDATARQNQVRPYPPSFASRLDRYTALRTPFVVDSTTERYLQATGRFVPEYYRGLVDVFTQQDFARKLADMERGGELLVPAAQLALPTQMAARNATMDWAHYDRARETFYRHLLLYPLSYQRRQTPFMPDLQLAQYLFTQYVVVEQFDEYVILQPKDHSSSPSSSSSPSMPVEPPK